jgi:hypothetical protein
VLLIKMSAASNRKITTNEIQAVGSILQDKEAIELLKKINDQVVTEEDTKGKRKQNDIFAFVGFAHQDDILGEDKESKEYQQNQGVLKKLVDSGLVDEGFHVPLERKNEKKFGDVHLPATDEKVGKYRISETGLTLLALVSGNGNNGQQQQKEGVDSKRVNSATGAIEEGISPQQKATKKEKQIATFKEAIKEENKL